MSFSPKESRSKPFYKPNRAMPISHLCSRVHESHNLWGVSGSALASLQTATGCYAFLRGEQPCSHSYPNPFSHTAIHPLPSSRVTQEAARIHSSPYGKTGFPTKGVNNCINLAMDWQEKSLKSTRIACSFLQEKKGVQHVVPPFSRISRISDFSVPGQEFPSGGNRHRH